MSVYEGKLFQCLNCNEKFSSKIRLESHCALEHDRSKLKRKKQIPARFCEPEHFDTLKGSDQTNETKPTKAKKVKVSCQQNSVMLGHRFYSLPTEFGNARVRVRVNSTSRWRWQLACPYSANLRNPVFTKGQLNSE